MPKCVQDIVGQYFSNLLDEDLTVIANDEQYQERFDLWGSDYDKDDWKQFYTKLNEYRKAKGE